jgi:histidinol-phosphate aminotransferase
MPCAGDSGRLGLQGPPKVALSSPILSQKASFVRSVVQSLEGYVPGEQPQDRRYIKLNTNENPYPPSPRALETIKAAAGDDLRLYPDPTARELRRTAAEVYGLAPAQVIAGNGSDELLSMLFRTCIDEGSSAQLAYPVPTYSLYDTLATIHGTAPVKVPFPDDFMLPVEPLLAAGARLTIICNPNSPSGTLVPLPVIESFAARAAGLVVVDEAYADFARSTALDLLARSPNLLVLRSFSKSFSLAGMRIGLAFAAECIIRELEKVKDSYNLDRLSLAAGKAALEDLPWMQANVARVRAARDELVAELCALGFQVPASEANFVFAAVPTLPGAEIYRRLRDKGILVRYFPGPSLGKGVRITVGRPEENHALIEALRSILG